MLSIYKYVFEHKKYEVVHYALCILQYIQWCIMKSRLWLKCNTVIIFGPYFIINIRVAILFITLSLNSAEVFLLLFICLLHFEVEHVWCLLENDQPIWPTLLWPTFVQSPYKQTAAVLNSHGSINYTNIWCVCVRVRHGYYQGVTSANFQSVNLPFQIESCLLKVLFSYAAWFTNCMGSVLKSIVINIIQHRIDIPCNVL